MLPPDATASDRRSAPRQPARPRPASCRTTEGAGVADEHDATATPRAPATRASEATPRAPATPASQATPLTPAAPASELTPTTPAPPANPACVIDACRALEQAPPGSEPTLAELAAGSGYSQHHFQRLFKQHTGVTPKQYASQVRADRTRAALQTAPSVTDAITDGGFVSTGRFYERAPSMLGMTPTAYRRGAPGERIYVAIGECSLGSVLVAATEQGVCAIFLGDDPQPLLEDLQRRFASATIIATDASFEQTVALVVGLIEQPLVNAGTASQLPLDIRGTAFQQQVWQALREIPPGSTATYREIAERIGRPTASRAVAQACGANPVSVAIPCHRVVRTGSGALGGYHWGVERKAELLRRERG